MCCQFESYQTLRYNTKKYFVGRWHVDVLEYGHLSAKGPCHVTKEWKWERKEKRERQEKNER